MKLALSTNWCNRRFESGEEIVDKALELGFDELELGFHTTRFQADGFKRRLDEMPVGSVHAFCPVPVSAPQGSPELYQLASIDSDARALARFHLVRTVEFAADMGATAVVLHAGRVGLGTFLHRGFGSADLRDILQKNNNDTASKAYAKALSKAMKLRRERGAALMEVFRGELSGLIPLLEKLGIVLGLENLPYLEGFPDEREMIEIGRQFAASPVKGWFDTGHDRVRMMHGWLEGVVRPPEGDLGLFAGMHLNDVKDYFDDHNAPGDGNVDFAALAPLARAVDHVVFEPKDHVSDEALARGIGLIRGLYCGKTA